eukprot:4281275-Prymnesium_polylepis.2
MAPENRLRRQTVPRQRHFTPHQQRGAVTRRAGRTDRAAPDRAAPHPANAPTSGRRETTKGERGENPFPAFVAFLADLPFLAAENKKGLAAAPCRKRTR